MVGEDTEASEERECAAEGQPMNDYEKERLRVSNTLTTSPLLRSPPPSAVGKGKQKNLATDADEEYLPSDGGDEEEEESLLISEQDDEEEDINSSSRSHKKVFFFSLVIEGKSSFVGSLSVFEVLISLVSKGEKQKMLNSGKSSEGTSRKDNASLTDFVDDDAALQQAIALSLTESLENSVAAMHAETSSMGMEGSDSTPCKKNDDVPIQDSAKISKIKKQERAEYS
ncbi:hypothetical protein GUJ93_ZPchr0014g47013 [Zizania palustris]|uniref:Uncharacterized protein n=1 Tax=Zizania palustris TaxID=103762 RepID=A0A8J5W6R1_ZIZPA|nr:hypothetical protein GUJ93_ZPchr0014g47013 [Zizania palustris]